MSTSATCDLVLYAARLLFLKVHQYRKRRLISRQASIVSGPRTIVRSVLSAVNHHSTCNKVLSTLSIFKSIAQQAGINSTIVAGYSGITNPGDDVVRLLQTANSDLDLGRAISLEVEGWCVPDSHTAALDPLHIADTTQSRHNNKTICSLSDKTYHIEGIFCGSGHQRSSCYHR